MRTRPALLCGLLAALLWLWCAPQLVRRAIQPVPRRTLSLANKLRIVSPEQLEKVTLALRDEEVAAARPALETTNGAVVEYNALFWNINRASKTDQLGRMGAVLGAHGASLVAMSEVPWPLALFTERAMSWGYPYSLLLHTKLRRFNIGLMSKMPLTRAAEARGAPFFHGVLCATVAQSALTCCVTHLTPHAPADRLAEAYALLRLLQPVNDGPLLLLGDLNALSPHDAAMHVASDLARKLAGTSVWQKFSAAPSGGTIDYSVLRTLTSSSPSSSLADLQRAATAQPTVPTNRGGDPRHAAPMRLDYALANRRLRERCPQLSSQTVSDEEAGSLSDHFPVLVRKLCLGGAIERRAAGQRPRFGGQRPNVLDGVDTVSGTRAEAADDAVAAARAAPVGRDGAVWQHVPNDAEVGSDTTSTGPPRRHDGSNGSLSTPALTGRTFTGHTFTADARSQSTIACAGHSLYAALVAPTQVRSGFGTRDLWMLNSASPCPCTPHRTSPHLTVTQHRTSPRLASQYVATPFRHASTLAWTWRRMDPA